MVDLLILLGLRNVALKWDHVTCIHPFVFLIYHLVVETNSLMSVVSILLMSLFSYQLTHSAL
jgi:hypothetical protein